MRIISGLLFTAFLSLTVFWLWVNHPIARNWAIDLFRTQKYKTLEVRYSADMIMEKHKPWLLKDQEHSYLDPSLLFYPYLLMDVKYSKSKERTSESKVLWSMSDGEMITNANTWESTHGFIDCIRAGADKADFKIINAISSSGGHLDKDTLSKKLNVEADVLDNWLEAAKRKSLVVQAGNLYRLHFQNPRLYVAPETQLNQSLATAEFKSISRIRANYRSSQIEGLARSAFGPDFTIRKTNVVYLPVYTITVQNPDGTRMISYWNALNGKRLPEPYTVE